MGTLRVETWDEHGPIRAKVGVASAFTAGQPNSVLGALVLETDESGVVDVPDRREEERIWLRAEAEGHATVEGVEVPLMHGDQTFRLVLPRKWQSKRRGVTRVNGRCLEDDGGPFPSLGTTAFPLPFLFRNDRDRCERTMRTIRDAGVFDFARTFTGVAGVSWSDRIIPIDDVEATMECASMAFQKYGFRLAHTISADGQYDAGFDTPAKRERIIDLYGDAVQGREEAFQSFEIVNENYDAKLDVNELRRLGQRLQARTRVPVILSAPGNPADYLDMYSGVGLKLANMHGERKNNSADGGRWEPYWKPYEFPWDRAEFGDSRRGDATACSWLEPIGPGSSVAEDWNVERLIYGFVLTHLLGCTAHVLHCVAGIRLGGEWDRNRGVPEWLEDTPGWTEIIAGLRAAKAYLPPDIGHWHREAGHRNECPINFIPYRGTWPDGSPNNGPFDDGTIFKAAVATNGNKFMGAALRLGHDLDIAPRQACHLEILDARSGAVIDSADLATDQRYKLKVRNTGGWNWDGGGVLLRGTWR